MKGTLDLMTPAMAVAEELTGVPDFAPAPSDVFEAHLGYIHNLKKAVLMVAGSAAQKLMMSLAKEQEILMNIADMMIWTYTVESNAASTEARRHKGRRRCRCIAESHHARLYLRGFRMDSQRGKGGFAGVC
jgi:hypothetical protein